MCRRGKRGSETATVESVAVRVGPGQGRCADPRAARRLADRFHGARFVVLDFADVAEASEAWLAALVKLEPDRPHQVVPINLTLQLRARLERALRHAHRREFLRADF